MPRRFVPPEGITFPAAVPNKPREMISTGTVETGEKERRHPEGIARRFNPLHSEGVVARYRPKLFIKLDKRCFRVLNSNLYQLDLKLIQDSRFFVVV